MSRNSSNRDLVSRRGARCTVVAITLTLLTLPRAVWAQTETPMSSVALQPEQARAEAEHAGPNRITFTVDGSRVVGTLFLPASYTAGARVPLVLVEGPWTQVKEQVGYRYGELLAAAGFAALALDHRGWGESEGVRSYESTTLKVADWKGALDFVSAHPAIDASRIGALGVCAGAGVIGRLVAEDARIRSFGTAAAWLQHPSTTPQFYGGADGVAAREALSDAAKATFEASGQVDRVAAYDPAPGSTAAMFFPVDYYGNPSRGRIPPWRNEFAVMGWREWLDMDAIQYASRVRVPVVMVHSDGSALPDNARRFFAELATPADQKRLVWVEGEHTQFYDQETQVQLAARPLIAHFVATLK